MAQLNIINLDWLSVYGEYTYSQNISANTTTLNLSVKARIKQTGAAGYDSFQGRIQYGGNFTSGGKNINLGQIATHTLVSKTYTVNHNNDGSVPSGVGIQFSVNNADAGWTYSSHKYIDSFIPRINRGSRITNTTTSSNRLDFGTQTTLTIERDVSDYTCDLYYKIGDVTHNIASWISANTYNYTFPTSLINSFTNTANVDLTLYCKTLETNVITESTIYLKVPNSYIPNLNVGINDTNTICKNWGIYVKSKSILEVSLNATGVSGSTITSYNSTIGNYNSSLGQFTTTALSNSSNEDTTIMPLICKVVDSRGRIKQVTNNLVVHNYFVPTFSNVEVLRCNADGTLNNVGTCAKVRLNYKVAPCNNKNVKQLKIVCSGQTKTITLPNYQGIYESSVSELFNNMLIDSNYQYTLQMTDSFGTQTITSILPNSYITRSYKAGGKGIAFGELATADGFSCNMIANFKSSVKQNNKDLATKEYVDGIVSSGTNSNGSWIKYADGTMICNMILATTISVNEGWGSLYFGRYSNPINFPQTFTQITGFQRSVLTTSSSSCWLIDYAQPILTNSSYQNVTIARPTSSNSVPIKFYLTVFGKWK